MEKPGRSAGLFFVGVAGRRRRGGAPSGHFATRNAEILVTMAVKTSPMSLPFWT